MTSQRLPSRARYSVRAAFTPPPMLARSRRAGDCVPYLFVLLLLAWQRASAQLAPADDFFNGGAQFYISNNVPAALERVELGLKTYPDDEKLKKLEQLLKQQQQQQNQQPNQQQQQQKQDQQKDQPQKNQQSLQQNSQDQKKQDKPKQNQAEQKKEEQQKPQEQQKASAQKQDAEKHDKPDAEANPVKPGEMTPEEARRLLDAQKGNEQLLQQKPQEKPRKLLRPVKDW